MIGKILGTTIKVVTLPIDAANAAMDVLCGGDGSKKSRNLTPTPLSFLENVRDVIAETAEKIDDEK